MLTLGVVGWKELYLLASQKLKSCWQQVFFFPCLQGACCHSLNPQNSAEILSADSSSFSSYWSFSIGDCLNNPSIGVVPCLPSFVGFLLAHVPLPLDDLANRSMKIQLQI